MEFRIQLQKFARIFGVKAEHVAAQFTNMYTPSIPLHGPYFIGKLDMG
jgi:hypothetical protein